MAAAKAGEPVRVVTALDEGWCQAKLPVVEIRGTEQPEQFVLLHGHYDSWDVGVGDNATGNAAMLEIARVLWQHRGKLKRSVRLAWWPGHSTGRFAGSTWYADRFAIDILRNCVAQINCDSPGCRWATSYEIIPWMAENAAFVADVVRDAVGKPASGRRPPAANDYSFTNLGITGYLSSSSRIPAAEVAARGYYYVMGNGGNIEWHTVFDKFEIADRNILLDDIKVYLLAVWRNANAVLLPYDWSALLVEFADTVSNYQRAAGSRFDLAPARDAVAALQDSVARFERRGQCGQYPADRGQPHIVAAVAASGAAELRQGHAVSTRHGSTALAVALAGDRGRARSLPARGDRLRADPIAARLQPRGRRLDGCAGPRRRGTGQRKGEPHGLNNGTAVTCRFPMTLPPMSTSACKGNRMIRRSFGMEHRP